jgi:hypothetical protein
MHIPRRAQTRAPWLQSHQTVVEVDSTRRLGKGGEAHRPVPRRYSMVAQVGCDEGGEMVEPRNQHGGRQKRNRVQAGLQHRERPCRPRVDGLSKICRRSPIPCFLSRPVSAPRTSPASLPHRVPLSRTHTVIVTRHHRPLSSAYLTRAGAPLLLPSLRLVAGIAAGGAPVFLGLHCNKTATATHSVVSFSAYH